MQRLSIWLPFLYSESLIYNVLYTCSTGARKNLEYKNLNITNLDNKNVERKMLDGTNLEFLNSFKSIYYIKINKN